MEKEDLIQHICQHVPTYCAAGQPTALSGGYLNFVWRIGKAGHSVVVKYTPPYIASNPAVDFDPKRLYFEATAMQLLQSQQLFSWADETIRTPMVHKFLPEEHILIMEDLGKVPHIGTWIGLDSTSEQEIEKALSALGRFLGLMHRESVGRKDLAKTFQNTGVQQVRQHVQYETGKVLEKLGVPHADEMGEIITQLGKQVLQPGICLTMGDLWPTSIMVQGTCDLRLIDWEFAHYGWPVQDVAHFAAHLWLFENRAEEASISQKYTSARGSFMKAYAATRGDVFRGMEELRQYDQHFGNEILMRTVGNFQDGYIYEGLTEDHPSIQRAVAVAVAHIWEPQHQDTFRLLHSPNS